MTKFRIFMVGFGGAIHCPFHMGFTDFSKDGSEPLYFDTVEQAAEYIREHVNLQKHDYVILPCVSL
jgi:hypothetical protein